MQRECLATISLLGSSSDSVEYLMKDIRNLKRQLKSATRLQVNMQQELVLLRRAYYAEQEAFQATLISEVRKAVEVAIASCSPAAVGPRVPTATSKEGVSGKSSISTSDFSKLSGRLGQKDINSSDCSTEDNGEEDQQSQPSVSRAELKGGAPVLQLVGLLTDSYAAHSPLTTAQVSAVTFGTTPQSGKTEPLPPEYIPMDSIGSAGHDLGLCKPCAFIFKGGCQNGKDCGFCHRCDSGEKKRRQKEKAKEKAMQHATAKYLQLQEQQQASSQRSIVTVACQ
jgi:hypothetical protein